MMKTDFCLKGQQEVMMSPQDFLRSITPGIPQPEDLGLDSFLTIPANQIDTVYLGVDEDSIFHQLGSGSSTNQKGSLKTEFL